MSIKNVVKVMNFHSLIRVDKARKKAAMYFDTEEELFKLIKKVIFNKNIILENGQEFYGFSFGYDEDKVCEIVFNTSMVGYQEILTDPTCAGQLVAMTFPLIGNYGINDEDFETEKGHLNGGPFYFFVTRSVRPLPTAVAVPARTAGMEAKAERKA